MALKTEKHIISVQVNGSKRNITLGDLRRYFQGTGDVVTFRFRESEFSDTWTLFVSFESYIQAKRACRVRGSLMGNHVFKHMANERVEIDPERTYFFEGVPCKFFLFQRLKKKSKIAVKKYQYIGMYAKLIEKLKIYYIRVYVLFIAHFIYDIFPLSTFYLTK